MPSQPCPLVVFCGGGSGGHLKPGIALARALIRRRGDVEVRFLTSGKDLESRLLAREHFLHCDLPAAPFSTRPARLAKFLVTASSGYAQALQKFLQWRADLVIGLGGYASVLPAFAAWSVGVPVVALEQNALPGKATRAVALIARELYTHFEESARYLGGAAGRVLRTGNPVSPTIGTGASRDRALQGLGLSPERRTLCVLGGSQGARSLDQRLLGALDRFGEFAPYLQVVHQCRPESVDEVSLAYLRAGIPALVRGFFTEMADLYAAADLVICRAGATTIAELERAGKPSILVPLPSAADDHQNVNARIIEARGCAWRVPQDECRAEVLHRLVHEFVVEGPDYRRVRDGAAAFAVRHSGDAALRIIERLERYLPQPRAHPSSRLRPAG